MALKSKEMGHSAIGITDHGTMAGVIQFIKACRNESIKPVVGMEAYFCRHMTEKQKDGRKGNRHLNLFAKNLEGYRNLCRLSQAASLEGFYHDNRIDIEILEKHKEGLIVSSACLKGIVNWNLKVGRYDYAKKAASMFKDIFNDDFYLEVMYHGIDDEAKIIPDIQKLSKELNIKMFCSNDSHYETKEEAKIHDIVLCLSQRGKCRKNPKRIRFTGEEFYLKSTEEMFAVFRQMPQSMKNTLEVAEKCDLSELQFGGMNLPKVDIPEEFDTPYAYLEHLAWEGLKKKGFADNPEYVDRLKLELSDIKLIYDTKKYHFDSYFLIVWDIINFIRKNNIPYGIRGSGNGSLLLYSLGVSKVNPLDISYQLSWERFLGFENINQISQMDFNI